MKYRFKHGDVVLVTDEENPGTRWYMRQRRLAVALWVDLSKHPEFIAGSISGLYLFRGQWYGRNHLNIASYGKCEGLANAYYNKHAYRVGHVSAYIGKRFN